MKKLLVFFSALFVLLLAAVACDQADPPAESGTNQIGATELNSEMPTEVPTEAPTVPPEWLTYTETEKVIEIPTEAPTEVVTEAPGDPTVPVTVIGTDRLSAGLEKYNLDNGIRVEDDYVIIEPTGEDPYYKPHANFIGARYIIIKYRTSNCNGINMQVYLGSSGGGPSDDSTMLEAPLVGDGNWNYLVIDTQPLIKSGKYDGKNVSYLRFDPLDPGYALDENGEKYKAPDGSWARGTMPEGARVDVAYIAFCHAPDTMQNLESES